jgi:hypothetical protein
MRTTYKTLTLDRALLAINVYNKGLYGEMPNPDLDERAREVFEGGLGITTEKILEQVNFVGKDYGGAAGFKAAYALAPDIARDIASNRAQYEQAVRDAQPILIQVPRQAAIDILYRPFVKPLHGKSNWHVWFTKFCFWLNQRAFPIEDRYVNEFFKIVEANSPGKYQRFAEKFRTFTLASQSWLLEMRKVDDGADSQPCSDNKLWDKVFYGLGEMGKAEKGIRNSTCVA